jgi:hypothetical protein
LLDDVVALLNQLSMDIGEKFDAFSWLNEFSERNAAILRSQIRQPYSSPRASPGEAQKMIEQLYVDQSAIAGEAPKRGNTNGVRLAAKQFQQRTMELRDIEADNVFPVQAPKEFADPIFAKGLELTLAAHAQARGAAGIGDCRVHDVGHTDGHVATYLTCNWTVASAPR